MNSTRPRPVSSPSWTTPTTKSSRLIARLRLARVQAAQGKYDDALATLKVEEPGEFAPRLADTRGDVLLAKGDRDGALREYLAARCAPKTTAASTSSCST